MKIRRCHREDLEALKVIFAKVYPRNLLLQDNRYLEWQFRKHPWNDENQYTLFVLEDKDSTIQGFYGYVCAKYVVDGGTYQGCEPAIWWTSSKAGFYGLALFQAVTKNQKISIFMDCSAQSLAVFDKLEIPSTKLQRVIGILNAEKVLKLFSVTDRDILVSNERKLAAAVKSVHSDEIRTTHNFAKSNTSALAKFADIRGHIAYSPEYLQWRYGDIPYHNYQCICTDEGDFAVYRIEPIMDSGANILRIVEWCVRPSNGKAVLANFRKAALSMGAVLMDFFCSNTTLSTWFIHDGGFAPQNAAGMEGVTRWVNPVNAAPPIVAAIDADKATSIGLHYWYLTTGNGDADRFKTAIASAKSGI
jgi:hypothetical protein